MEASLGKVLIIGKGEGQQNLRSLLSYPTPFASIRIDLMASNAFYWVINLCEQQDYVTRTDNKTKEAIPLSDSTLRGLTSSF